jgi:NADPH-dependent 2,4-dienoyl-CoA reductase/sulfur reductase-like enzyme
MNITVQTRHEVIALDPKAGRVTVRNLEAGTDATFGYDLLMYATGATAFVPPIAGLDLAGVHSCAPW